ncbi:MAG: hypothetical protein IKE01_01595 [Clostridia bacterium]|nr:hypothetical protein [Clostridia bacterium]MBR2785882.1 hypothetical protein [Clostridia bacterium]
MKRRILLVFLIIAGLIVLTGCGNKISSTTNSSNRGNEKEIVSSMKIGNIDLDLNRSGSFNAISYKYPENAMASNVGTYSVMDVMNGEELVVRIAMYFYENKTMGDVNAGAGLSSVDAIEYNNNVWNVYEGTKDGKKVINYVTQEGDDSYTITFISDNDTTNFSNEFMKTVKFNR